MFVGCNVVDCFDVCQLCHPYSSYHDMKKDDIKPFLPFYAELPNKVVGYREQLRICELLKTPKGAIAAGYRYRERIAIYLNKDKKVCEATCQIKWIDDHGSPYIVAAPSAELN